MNAEPVINEIARYESELAGILSRFTHTRDGIHIGREDDPIFRQYVRELIDLFNDALGENSYSIQIVAEFNDGIRNYVGSPSFKSVENILSIVRAALTRFTKRPELLVRKDAEVSSVDPARCFCSRKAPQFSPISGGLYKSGLS